VRIGIDLGGTKIEFLALGPGDHELHRYRIDTPAGQYAETIALIAENVRFLETQTGLTGTIGIGIPGTISPTSGRVMNANSVWLNGQPFDRDLAAALGREIRVANDANCFALSEATDGAGSTAGSVFGVILGTGVGGGLVLNGRHMRGANAIGGEWGHNPLPRRGHRDHTPRDCWCGRQDCIETYLSGPALEGEYTAIAGTAAKATEIVSLAADGDSGAETLLSLYEERAARALATVINLYDPEIIVLGGGLSNIERFYEAIPRLWKTHVFSDRVTTRLEPPVHGDSSGVRGAARLWPEYS